MITVTFLLLLFFGGCANKKVSNLNKIISLWPFLQPILSSIGTNQGQACGYYSGTDFAGPGNLYTASLMTASTTSQTVLFGYTGNPTSTNCLPHAIIYATLTGSQKLVFTSSTTDISSNKSRFGYLFFQGMQSCPVNGNSNALSANGLDIPKVSSINGLSISIALDSKTSSLTFTVLLYSSLPQFRQM
jgi:hypothetical protein